MPKTIVLGLLSNRKTLRLKTQSLDSRKNYVMLIGIRSAYPKVGLGTALLSLVSKTSFSVLAFIPKAQSTWILVVYLLGKGASGAGFQMVWMYTNELFPTNLRGQVP